MDKINKALHGVIQPGSCYHEYPKRTSGMPPVDYCIHCKKGFGILHSSHDNPDYFSKEGFWDALQDAKSRLGFMVWFEKNHSIRDLHFLTFAKIYYEFLVAEGIITESGS